MVLKVKLLDESYLVVQVKRVQKECTVIHKVNDLMCMVVLVLPDTDFNLENCCIILYKRVFYCLWQFCDSLFLYVGINCTPIIKPYLKTAVGEVAYIP